MIHHGIRNSKSKFKVSLESITDKAERRAVKYRLSMNDRRSARMEMSKLRGVDLSQLNDHYA
jgi:hypothetical protein